MGSRLHYAEDANIADQGSAQARRRRIDGLSKTCVIASQRSKDIESVEVPQDLSNDDPSDKKLSADERCYFLGGYGSLLFKDSHFDLSTPKGSWVVLVAINMVTERYLKGKANQYGQTTGREDIESVIEDAVDVFTGRIDGVIMAPFYSREILGTRLIVRFELDPGLLANASFRSIVRHALFQLQKAMVHQWQSERPESAGSLMAFAHDTFYPWPSKPEDWVRLSEFMDESLAQPHDLT